MPNNSQPSFSKHIHIQLFFLIACLNGIVCIVYLLLIPADTRNAIFLGYSINRLILIGGLLFPTLMFLILALLFKKNPTITQRFYQLLGSQQVTIISGILALLSLITALWSLSTSSQINFAVFDRLRPIIFWIFLLSSQTLVFQYLFNKSTLEKLITPLLKFYSTICQECCMIVHQLSNIFEKPGWNILVIIILSTPILLQNAIRYPLPVGVSGLYALMAETIQINHFALPFEIPYYGPGGTPFAYPPLAFYLMAIFTGIFKISPIEYMRFAAPVFCLIALIPMYLLTRRITSSGIIATIAALLLATYARIYLIHGQAAGLARTLAFIFALAGLYFFYSTLQKSHWRNTLLAAVFFGLSILTHPTYAEFFAVGAASFVLVGTIAPGEKILSRIKQGVFVVLLAVFVSAPWWLNVLINHGAHLFSFASTSHNSLDFLTVIKNPVQIPDLVSNFMSKVNKTPMIAGPAILGLFYQIVKGKWTLPVWFFTYIFIFGGYDFLIIPITAILAAMILYEIIKLIQQNNETEKPTYFAPLLFIVIILGLCYYDGYRAIAKYQPDLSLESFHMAEWFQSNTQSDSTFLRITSSSEEAEWYPYLLRRTPVLASWGSEWTGDYQRQYGLVNQIVECSINQSLTCINDTTQKINVQPQYIITNTAQDQLNLSILQSAEWIKRYDNPDYVVWEYIGDITPTRSTDF